MSLQNLLRIKYPIVQAPMAGSDNPEFIATACNAGILGSLGAQYRTPEEITKAIIDIRHLTDKPFAVNLFAMQPPAVPTSKKISEAILPLQQYYEHFNIPIPSTEIVKTLISPESQINAVLQARVPVFSFTLGILNEEWIKAFKAQSTLLIGTATNVKEAVALEKAGVDIITVQSCEAGGHRGTFIGSFENSLIGGLALIPQVVDAVKIPVIAAGGIMDGRGIAAALVLGAEGVQLGTAFLTVLESPANAEYKKAVTEHNAEETTITKVFSGAPARGIKNKFIETNDNTPLLPFPYHNLLTQSFRKVASKTGQIEYTNLWSGQGGLLAKQMPLSELVNSLMIETEVILNKFSSLKWQ
jgi:nitronate monooxygenase